jgi:hypothetical protein
VEKYYAATFLDQSPFREKCQRKSPPFEPIRPLHGLIMRDRYGLYETDSLPCHPLIKLSRFNPSNCTTSLFMDSHNSLLWCKRSLFFRTPRTPLLPSSPLRSTTMLSCPFVVCSAGAALHCRQLSPCTYCPAISYGSAAKIQTARNILRCLIIDT